MNKKEIYWHAESPKYHWAHARMKLIAETIQSDASIQSVLDVGAGSGTLAHLLGRNLRYLGLDITGRKELDDMWPVIRFCDFDRVEAFNVLIEHPFDAVVISGVLEYLQDWRGFFQTSVHEGLRPGGRLLVSAIDTRFYETFPVKRHPAWINRFIPADLRSAIADNGLRLDMTYPMWTGGHPWTSSLSRLFACRGQSVHAGWLYWLGVNQYLFACRREE